jgi:DNA-binding MarR family transcriptional regulator
MLAPYGVTPLQYQALRAVGDGQGICHGQLAGTLGLDKPSATRLLQTLERKGWVRVRKAPCQGRKLAIELTEGGAALAARMDPFREAIRGGLDRGFSPLELAQLREFLKRLAHNLDRLEAEQGVADVDR